MKVQLSRGSMVSTMEAAREREKAGRVKHQHSADTQRNVTHITQSTAVLATTVQYLEKAAQNKCTV